MRIAWFAPEPNDIARELGHLIVVDHVDARRAHDFVWQHFQAPYDLTVFELGDRRQYEFVWPYLFHYPGVVLLQAPSLQHSRTDMLAHQQRHHHLRLERTFSGWHFLRAPLLASRLIVVHDEVVGRELRDEFPELPIRVLPIGVAPMGLRSATEGPGGHPRPVDGITYRFHVAGPRRDVVDRAARRARETGAAIDVTDLDGVTAGDVVIALDWPPTVAPPIQALRAMAAGLPAIVLETEAVAAWPTLDPQTWQRRGYGNAAPIAVSIDPRDEEHSLMLALRRLARDPGLRASLGAAARSWAGTNTSVVTAAARWRDVLEQARCLTPPGNRAELPAHLVDDGTERARRVLEEFGLSLPELG